MTQVLGGQFGFAMAADQGLALVGAPGNQDAASFAGTAHVFDLTTATQLQRLMGSGLALRTRLGWSVALHGTRAVVGQAMFEVNEAVHLYDALTGFEQSRVPVPAGFESVGFGAAVAIHGDVVLVGAPLADPDGCLDRGLVFQVDWSSAMIVGSFDPGEDAGVQDDFGSSIALKSKVALVGAPSTCFFGIGFPGRAFLFDARDFRLLAALDPAQPGQVDYFEAVVGLDESYAVVGQPYIGVTRGGAAEVANGIFFPAGELLVDPTSSVALTLSRAHFGGVERFSAPVSNDVAVCGLVVYARGAVFGLPGVELSNALDLTIGL